MAKTTRRDFLYLTTASFGAVGLGAGVLKLIDSMNPAKDVAALASVEVDVKSLKVGEQKTIAWRGKPVFIRRRTPGEIHLMNETPLSQLKDPQTDKDRFGKNQEYLVVIGVCTHLGCIPGERKAMKPNDAGGWLCACHGSVYDDSGRILRGPAPRNLEVPPYEFMPGSTTLKIG